MKDDDLRAKVRENQKSDPIRNFGDGRDVHLSHGSLFPSQNSREIGRAAGEAVRSFASKMKHTCLEDSGFPFEHELVCIADNFSVQQRCASLPRSEEYRDLAKNLSASASNLLSQIVDNTTMCTQLDREMRRQAQIPLLASRSLPHPSLQHALSQLVALCSDMEKVQSPPGDRPRNDYKILARQIAEIWERMTGSYCPTSVDRKETGGNFDFLAEGPEFVLIIARVIDPSIQPPQVATALRKRPPRKYHRQNSPLARMGTLHKTKIERCHAA